MRRRRRWWWSWVLVVGTVAGLVAVTDARKVTPTPGAVNLCGHVERLAHWVAYDTCFSLSFTYAACCPTEQTVSWFFNPSCFDENPFGVGSLDVCCKRRVDKVSIPVMRTVAMNGCWNGSVARHCTFGELLRSACPEVAQSLYVVTYLEAPWLMGPKNNARSGLQLLSPRSKLPSWRGLLLKQNSPLLGVLAEVWRRRQKQYEGMKRGGGRAATALRTAFLTKRRAGPPKIQDLPPTLNSLTDVVRRGNLLAIAASLLHAAVRLARAGESVLRAVDTAERLTERWARRCGVGRRRLRHRTWAALLKQPFWPIPGLLHLLWDIRWEYSDLGGIDNEPGWRQLRQAGESFKRTSAASAMNWPHGHDELGIPRMPEWPDALDPVAADAPSWSVPFLKFDTDQEVYGNKVQWTRCNMLRGLMIHVPDGSTVLDVGAGTAPCRHIWEARTDIKYLTQDAAHYDTSTHEKGNFMGGMFVGSSIEDRGYTTLDVVSDIADIPLPNASVDVVLCEQVLEHVLHPVAALQEMVRLLRTGGFLIVTVPYGPYLHNLPHHYNGGLTRGWFEHYLYEASVSKVWTAYRYTLPGRQLSRLGIAEQCVEAKQGASFARLWKHLIMDVIPPVTDALQVSCQHALQRRPQGIAVTAVK